MKMQKYPLIIAVLAAATISTTACSAGGGSDAQGTPTGPGNTTETSSAPEAVSPLSAYTSSLYGLSGSLGEQSQRNTEQRIEQEEVTAACMKAEGFDYIPRTIEAASSKGIDGPTDEDLDSRDWVAKYGFGLVEVPEGKTSELHGSKGEEQSPVDPNREYVDSLTPSEEEAYNTALSGTPVTDVEEHLNVLDDWAKMGCYGKASHETGERGDPLSSAAGAEVAAKIDDFYNAFATWPGLASLDRAWADCMSESGYPGFDRQGDARIQMGTKIETAREVHGTSDDELLVEEREIALADRDCRDETHYRDTVEEIAFVAETQFMNDNRAEFEAFAASVDQMASR